MAGISTGDDFEDLSNENNEIFDATFDADAVFDIDAGENGKNKLKRKKMACRSTVWNISLEFKHVKSYENMQVAPRQQGKIGTF
ncbi:hypothetical protein M569_11722 [Genlisea aurea]|uniref:Uncharacterized protein n=1 Tax=Genlisea aurea TaxID=192259 RepID=S8C8E4_9LAMI|nr:hypothetical protein M569_11722 [Genlisea aurea]